MAIEQNLYPPIMPDVIPAFIRTETCKVYFSLSIYNTVTDIKNVQVSLINQKTNKTAFRLKKDEEHPAYPYHPSGIKITDLRVDPLITNNYKYYIEISPYDLENNEFEINQFYKIQLRFTSQEASAPQKDDYERPIATAAWLSENTQYFSEWSTVNLLKGIEQPYIQINDLNTESSTTLLVPPTAFSGRMYYENNIDKEKEYLKSYNINIYETSTNKSIIKSNQIYTNSFNPNEFNYELTYDLPTDINYTLSFTYTTNNLYTETVNFQFKIAQQATNKLNVVLQAIAQPENGRIKVDINFENSVMNPSRNLYIKRTSSRTNFQIWETLKTIQHDQNPRHIWYDTSIESGVWYKYRVQQVNDVGVGKTEDTRQPVICLFEDIFLTQGERQLKIQFNPAISDLKYNVTESQQVTLGSKYPYVKRNGNNFFRSFSISGLITAFMDQTGWYDPNFHDGKFFFKNQMQSFTTQSELYGESKSLYDQYNTNNNISNYQDYIYEREFRQKVCDFLYQNNIKLFRSLTEGNMLIKLMNISLQPVNQLGRRLYSFSATAIEIDDNIMTNYIKYKILNKFYYSYSSFILSDIFESGQSIIQKFYNQNNQLSKDLIDIMKLKININSTEKNFVVYAQALNNKQFVRHIVDDNNYLQLNYSDADPIADCYFYGIAIDKNQYTITNQYYDTIDDIRNPINNRVYYVAETYTYKTYKIDNYEAYSAAGILTTYPSEVLQNGSNYTLLVQKYYNKYIYYKNNWYLLSDNDEILINNINATIQYYYRIKMEG